MNIMGAFSASMHYRDRRILPSTFPSPRLSHHFSIARRAYILDRLCAPSRPIHNVSFLHSHIGIDFAPVNKSPPPSAFYYPTLDLFRKSISSFQYFGAFEAGIMPHPPLAQDVDSNADDPPTKRDLASWWRNFKKTGKKDVEKPTTTPNGIFGVPLQTSIRYANVAISLSDADGRSFTYGYVPIVVAKCGVFLKERGKSPPHPTDESRLTDAATDIEGIFRLAGAERRMKELQTIFNNPDRYGKGLDWTGYTVHDASNILRRYLNQLPEPIIPLDFYQRFRDTITIQEGKAAGESAVPDSNDADLDVDAAIKTYQQLITELPPLNRQLLLYILDLLAVFASKSDMNLMTASNLSAIFQPAIIRHPDHDMAPKEYRLNQDVLSFLIDNQDHFLVGMQGTAADEKTIQDVQNGALRVIPGPAPRNWGPQLVGRTSSNASAGAESVRRFGNVRRNASVTSRRSRHSAQHTPSPGTPPPDSPYSSSLKAGGVQRSNTVPSKHQPSPALASTRFQKSSDQSEPTVGISSGTIISPVPSSGPIVVKKQRESSSSPRSVSSPSNIAADRMSPHLRPVQTAKGRDPSRDRQLRNDLSLVSPRSLSPTGTSTREHTFSSFFKPSSSTEGDKRDGRKPNKLQKKRPDATSLSAQASSRSLGGGSIPASPSHVSTNPETQVQNNESHPEASKETINQTSDGYESAMEDLPPPVMAQQSQNESASAHEQ